MKIKENPLNRKYVSKLLTGSVCCLHQNILHMFYDSQLQMNENIPQICFDMNLIDSL